MAARRRVAITSTRNSGEVTFTSTLPREFCEGERNRLQPGKFLNVTTLTRMREHENTHRYKSRITFEVQTRGSRERRGDEKRRCIFQGAPPSLIMSVVYEDVYWRGARRHRGGGARACGYELIRSFGRLSAGERCSDRTAINKETPRRRQSRRARRVARIKMPRSCVQFSPRAKKVGGVSSCRATKVRSSISDMTLPQRERADVIS